MRDWNAWPENGGPENTGPKMKGGGGTQDLENAGPMMSSLRDMEYK